MPATFGLIDRWACKIGRSFISYAHETKSQKRAGMQDQRKLHFYAHETKSQN